MVEIRLVFNKLYLAPRLLSAEWECPFLLISIRLIDRDAPVVVQQWWLQSSHALSAAKIKTVNKAPKVAQSMNQTFRKCRSTLISILMAVEHKRKAPARCRNRAQFVSLSISCPCLPCSPLLFCREDVYAVLKPLTRGNRRAKIDLLSLKPFSQPATASHEPAPRTHDIFYFPSSPHLLSYPPFAHFTFAFHLLTRDLSLEGSKC
jgi:hypothetical protein